MDGVSLEKAVHPATATTNHVDLAPGHIQETLTLASVRALGVNGGSSALFQGATLGLEHSF